MPDRTSSEKREDLILAMVAKGKTRDQAEAALDILGSAFRRRGWGPGEPLSQDELSDRVDRVIGNA